MKGYYDNRDLAEVERELRARVEVLVERVKELERVVQELRFREWEDVCLH